MHFIAVVCCIARQTFSQLQIALKLAPPHSSLDKHPSALYEGMLAVFLQTAVSLDCLEFALQSANARS